MASTQIQTSGLPNEPNSNTHNMARAGSRIWVIVSGDSNGSDTGTNLFYSDNDGGSWTKPTGGDLDTANGTYQVSIDAALVGATWELHMCWAAGDATYDKALKHSNILSNVDSGTPGTITTNTVDAGGANAGIFNPSIAISPSASNPKVWIVGGKCTAAGPTVENRLWRAPATTASPTYTSYNDINSTSASIGSGTISNAYSGCLAYWSISAAVKMTVIVKHRVGTTYDSFTFDPSAASPTLGSATNFSTGSFDNSVEQSGPLCFVNAKADYLIFGRNTASTAATWDIFKTVNGTSWSNPTGWTAITAGYMNSAYDGTNFWLLHGASYSSPGTTVVVLKYRLITVSSDNMGGVTTFSDTSGNPVSTPRDTGTTKLYGSYRGSTSSPYTVRSDFVSIGGGGDVTPPSQASVSILANTAGARNDITAIMPADIDVSQYEIRFLTTDYPLTDRTNGTVIVSPTGTSANATVVFNHTSLTNGTRYFYRVFVKDTAGNWNTGSTVTSVASTLVGFLQRYTSAGVAVADGILPAGNNPILEFQMASANFESGKVAHFRLRTGNDNATPPTQVTTDYVSSSGGTTFRYEDPAASGTWVNVPISGMSTTFFGRKLRVYTTETQTSRYFSLRVEQ